MYPPSHEVHGGSEISRGSSGRTTLFGTAPNLEVPQRMQTSGVRPMWAQIPLSIPTIWKLPGTPHDDYRQPKWIEMRYCPVPSWRIKGYTHPYSQQDPQVLASVNCCLCSLQPKRKNKTCYFIFLQYDSHACYIQDIPVKACESYVCWTRLWVYHGIPLGNLCLFTSHHGGPIHIFRDSNILCWGFSRWQPPYFMKSLPDSPILMC